jgi:hypothetical protein
MNKRLFEKPLAAFYCHYCGSSALELHLTKRSLGITCADCSKFIFDITDLHHFITINLFKCNALPEEDEVIN